MDPLRHCRQESVEPPHKGRVELPVDERLVQAGPSRARGTSVLLLELPENCAQALFGGFPFLDEEPLPVSEGVLQGPLQRLIHKPFLQAK